jgi:hypothetical protein
MSQPIVILLLVLLILPVTGQAELELTAFLGAPLTLGADLDIEQDGFADLDLSPHFKSEPFQTPRYYALRLGHKRGRDTWAVDFVHHKLILDEPTAEVQSFTVSHGYNVVSAMYLRSYGRWHGLAGLGVVFAHPESTVRGLVRAENDGIGGSGYHLTGPVLQIGGGGRIPLRSNIFLLGEARLMVSGVRVPIAQGEAGIREVSLHFLAGLGVEF